MQADLTADESLEVEVKPARLALAVERACCISWHFPMRWSSKRATVMRGRGGGEPRLDWELAYKSAGGAEQIWQQPMAVGGQSVSRALPDP